MWADRESHLSLVGRTCTCIRPRVQPCGWERYVRAFTVIHAPTNRTKSLTALIQLLLGITPLSEIPEPYSLPELGKRSGVFILHQLMPLFTISWKVISSNPLAQYSSQGFVKAFIHFIPVNDVPPSC